MESVTKFLADYKAPLLFGAGAVFGAVSLLAKNRAADLQKRNKYHKWGKDPVKDYCYNHSNIAEPEALVELRRVTAQDRMSVMESTMDARQLLVFLMRTIKAKTVVEVGSYTGVGLLSMALELPDDGKIFSLDISDEYVNIGKPFMEKAGVLKKIDYRIGPAIDSLLTLKKEGYKEKVDLCFIDADKNNYPNYYKLCLEMVRPGGIIVFDNALWDGNVVFNPKKEPNCFIHEINEKAAVDSRVTSILLCIADGSLILRKNDA